MQSIRSGGGGGGGGAGGASIFQKLMFSFFEFKFKLHM